ncbi:HD domain-containing protein [Candidatus Woesearchaeota archaeon]|jgi:3'-5' exoribonuclease|nr:HD domain-containing protein [Candidatus Woesearchaeota archaeon]
MNRKNQFIQEMKKDDVINDVFVVKFKKPVEQYKNGYKFELRLGDRTKEIMLKYWGPNDEQVVQTLYDSIKKDEVVFVQGRVSEWNNNLEIATNEHNEIKVLSSDEYSSEDFVRVTEQDVDLMYSELKQIIGLVKNSEIKSVLDYFFNDSEFEKKFKFSPAAMYVHHGWLGGLLEHSLSVVKLIVGLHKVHPNLDLDLLIAGAVLHDIGKLEEFEVKTSIRVSKKGMLLGHVSIGVDIVEKACTSVGIADELKMKLIHMIITHMGEYGSSKTPSFPEAVAVYYCDQMDSRITQIETLIKDANTEDETIYHKDFGNVFLK